MGLLPAQSRRWPDCISIHTDFSSRRFSSLRLLPPSSHVLIVGGSRPERRRAALARQESARPGSIIDLAALTLPFVRPDRTRLPVARPRVVSVQDLERAFPNQQAAGTRLVLTQSTYLLQKWIEVLDAGDVIIATAGRSGLETGAPEAFERRGPWRLFDLLNLDHGASIAETHEVEADPAPGIDSPASPPPALDLLARAYHSPSSAERERLCREAVAAAPDSPAAVLALANACGEQQDPVGARTALDEAIRLAPDWEAVHYENGKFWLACDDMERARGAFDLAVQLMPTFSAAASNLGAILGELDQPEKALEAFHQALVTDPDSYTLLNNIGVVNRELGRLDESEMALRQVIRIRPGFVFGHYNLGHTLLLEGKHREALEAYEEGQRLDPQKNRRQGCRLAIVRLVNGDVEGAERDLWRFADAAPSEERRDLLLEAYEIAEALTRGQGEARHRAFLDRIAAEITQCDL